MGSLRFNKIKACHAIFNTPSGLIWYHHKLDSKGFSVGLNQVVLIPGLIYRVMSNVHDLNLSIKDSYTVTSIRRSNCP